MIQLLSIYIYYIAVTGMVIISFICLIRCNEIGIQDGGRFVLMGAAVGTPTGRRWQCYLWEPHVVCELYVIKRDQHNSLANYDKILKVIH